MLSRTSKITAAIAAATTIGGLGLTVAAMVNHVPGTPFGASLFVGLSLAIIGCVLLGAVALHTSSDREAVYRLGYEAGRLDLIREMNSRERAGVTPLRPANRGLYSFNAQARSAAGRRARPSQRASGPDSHAGSHG